MQSFLTIVKYYYVSFIQYLTKLFDFEFNPDNLVVLPSRKRHHKLPKLKHSVSKNIVKKNNANRHRIDRQRVDRKRMF